jgi:hypothetical protein
MHIFGHYIYLSLSYIMSQFCVNTVLMVWEHILQEGGESTDEQRAAWHPHLQFFFVLS